MFELQEVVVKSIIFVAMILFTYWAARSFLLVRGVEAEINRKLARDLEWGRLFMIL